MTERQKKFAGGGGSEESVRDRLEKAAPKDPTVQINVRIPQSLRDWLDDETAAWLGSGWKPTKEGRRKWSEADIVIRGLELLRERKKLEDRMPEERAPRRKSR